jgi:hypothetical protein
VPFPKLPAGSPLALGGHGRCTPRRTAGGPSGLQLSAGLARRPSAVRDPCRCQEPGMSISSPEPVHDPPARPCGVGVRPADGLQSSYPETGRVLAVCGVLVLVSLGLVGTLLGSSLTSDSSLANHPESATAQDLIDARVPNRNPVDEVIVVRSERDAVSDPAYSTSVRAWLRGSHPEDERVADLITLVQRTDALAAHHPAHAATHVHLDQPAGQPLRRAVGDGPGRARRLEDDHGRLRAAAARQARTRNGVRPPRRPGSRGALRGRLDGRR